MAFVGAAGARGSVEIALPCLRAGGLELEAAGASVIRGTRKLIGRGATAERAAAGKVGSSGG